MKLSAVLAAVFLISTSLFADIAITDRASTLRLIASTASGQHAVGTKAVSQAARDLQRAENQAKRDAKRSKRHLTSTPSRIKATSAHRIGKLATGSISLTDVSGLQYFINTDITFSTSSSASGAASEASYTAPIIASTSAGGSTTSTLNDMFDGYNTICVSFTGAMGPCATGDANYTIYNQAGPAAFDTTVPVLATCTNRQVVTPLKTIGALSVQRKIFVPTNDSFIRWADYFTNTSATAVTFTMATGNNLGSDSNTRIVSSSNGDNVAQLTDTWISTFQNFSGNTSSDPRIGHVLQGTGAPTPLSGINFADGDDNPSWAYTITLAPGETKIILNFATGQGTKAAANAQAAALAALPASSTQCLSATELGQVTNFATATDLSITKTSTPAGTVNAGQAYSYNLAVTNNGPSTADSVTVTDALPAGVTFVNATGTGWSCSQAAGTVTCTIATLAVGAANPITINVTAPTAATTLSNTATVSSTTTDPTPGNNSSTVGTTVVAQSDLSIVKTSTPAGSAGAGQNFTYNLAVTNNGPSVATSVSVIDTLPAGVVYHSYTGAGWSCAAVGQTVTCTAASLAVGAATPIVLSVTAPAGATTLNNTATVTSATADPNPANNSSNSSLIVAASADLNITKTTSTATALAGVPISYSITVGNAGPSAASAVSVVDVIPAGSTFVSATGTGWTCTNAAGTVTCTTPTLAVGIAPVITLTITPGSGSGSISNSASVSSTTPDPTPANNVSAAVVVPLAAVVGAPTLSTSLLLLLAAILGIAAVIRSRT
jgi:uncharacterized repeat protein (TIGR01451 family)